MLWLAENLPQVAPWVRPAAGGTARWAADTAQPEHHAAVGSCARLKAEAGGTAWPEHDAVGRPKNPRLAQLAEQVRQLCSRGRSSPPRCSSGLPGLDAVLGGGFAAAAVHELLAGAEGAAVRSVALRTAAHAAGRSKWIFYIDTGADLCPSGVVQLGVPLGRLLVVRTPRAADALWVCEQALRCRAVGAVVLPLRTIDAYASRRLQLAAEAGGGLGLLICSDERGGGTFAASRLRFDPLVGEGAVRRLLVTVLKLREGRPCEPLVVELPDAADSVPARVEAGGLETRAGARPAGA